MVLYTDDLTETRNSSGELLKMERFLKIVEHHARGSPVVRQQERG